MPNHVWHDDDLRGAQFKRVDLSDAEFRDVNLTRARIVDAVLVDVELSGLIPPTSHHTVLQCLHVVLDEEWNHHQYAARDLATVNGVTAS